MRKSNVTLGDLVADPARASDYGPLSRLPSLMLKYLKDHPQMFERFFCSEDTQPLTNLRMRYMSSVEPFVESVQIHPRDQAFFVLSGGLNVTLIHPHHSAFLYHRRDRVPYDRPIDVHEEDVDFSGCGGANECASRSSGLRASSLVVRAGVSSRPQPATPRRRGSCTTHTFTRRRLRGARASIALLAALPAV